MLLVGSVTEVRAAGGLGRMPTTAAGCDRAFALLIVGIRLGTVVQMAPSLPQGMSMSSSASGYLVVWLLAAVTATAVSVIVWRTGRTLSPRAYLLDAAICCTVLLLGLLVVPESTRLGTWIGYQPGYAVSVLCSPAALRSNRAWLLGLVAIVASFLAFSLPALTAQTAAAIGSNTLTFLVLAGVGRWVALFIRRIAEDGDVARAQALELGRREEEHRAQLAIHNGAAVIRMLGDPGLDDASRALLQKEAQREAHRMRSYLQGRSTRLGATTSGMPSGPVTLPVAVAGVCERFTDLPIHATLDLAESVVLEGTVAEALDHALASVLLNIRDHARADTVVIHADGEGDGEGLAWRAGEPAPGPELWVLTVHDNGVGFSAEPREFGVGLREVVVGQLAVHGIHVDVSSTPGLGTTITITGRTAA